MGHRAVARRLDLGVGKLLVGELELLQPDHVRLPGAQPVEHEVQTGAQPVDVPRRDAHGASRPNRSRNFQHGEALVTSRRAPHPPEPNRVQGRRDDLLPVG